MAKQLRIQRRTYRGRQFITALFIFAVVAQLLSATVLRQYQARLSQDIQKTNRMIEQYTVLNQSINVEVAQLSTYDRIASLVKADGFTTHSNNIITITTQP